MIGPENPLSDEPEEFFAMIRMTRDQERATRALVSVPLLVEELVGWSNFEEPFDGCIITPFEWALQEDDVDGVEFAWMPDGSPDEPRPSPLWHFHLKVWFITVLRDAGIVFEYQHDDTSWKQEKEYIPL